MARVIGKTSTVDSFGVVTPISLIGLRDGGYVLSTTGFKTEPSAPSGTGFLFLDEKGRETSDVIPISDKNPGSQGSLLALSDGGFAFAWYGGSETSTSVERGLYLRFFDSDGTARGAEIEVIENVASFSLFNPPELIETDQGVKATVVGYQNPSVPFRLSTVSHDVSFDGIVASRELIPEDGSAVLPRSAVLENGREVLVYDSIDSAAWTLIEPDGTQVATNRADFIDVPNSIGDDPRDGQVTALKTGGYIITYEGFDRGLFGTDGIHGQRYDADGNPIGFRMLLSEESASDHTIIALNNGGFFVSWRGGEAQEFGPTGQPVGKQITLPALSADDAAATPILAESADGEVLAVYHTFAFTNDPPLVTRVNISDTSDFEGPINGNGKANTIIGTKGNDIIFARGQGDIVKGAKGHDEIYGENGSDTLIGGRGNDILDGGKGNDILRGNNGDDVLVAGTGNEKMIGGKGADVFVFRNGDGVSRGVIKDFEVGTDLISLTGFGNLYRENTPNQTETGNGLVVEFNTRPGQEDDYFRLILRGIDDQLSISDFVLT